MDSERWNLYHITNISASKDLQYWTFIEGTQDLIGVCVKVYDDGSNLPVEIHLTDADGNVNTYRRIDLDEGTNNNVF